MFKKITLLLIIGSVFINGILADEGMWLPYLLKLRANKMQQMGMQLSPDDIYSINKSSVKDAIVSLDKGGCSGEIISDQGLLLTNHHCAFSDIQFLSSPENDLLTNGFWARSLKEELPLIGKTATFLVSATDVTELLKKAIANENTPDNIQIKTKAATDLLISEAIKNTHYDAVVEEFFNGNQYILLVTETFTDIRLVGAPPSAIGKFGGDTDNWVWPRHTGDFSLYRVYMATDGKPAAYNQSNIPYKPKHFLPISLNGIKLDDFIFIMGYPGTTDRFASSWSVEQTMNITNKIRTAVRNEKLAIMRNAMQKSNELNIKYAARYAESSNYWKYSIGQNEGLTKLSVTQRKSMVEDSLVQWINASPERLSNYGNCINDLKAGYEANASLTRFQDVWFETLWQGSELLPFAFEHNDFYSGLTAGDATIPDEVLLKLDKKTKEFFGSFDFETEKNLLKSMLTMYVKSVPPPLYEPIKEHTGGITNPEIENYVNLLFQNSVFTNATKYENFRKKPDISVIENDPVFVLLRSALGIYFAIDAELEPIRNKINSSKKLYTQALFEKNPQREYYPDANSTMRLTYGKVCSYEPRDGVIYKHFTTLKGYTEKSFISNADYATDPKLLDFQKKNDFGQYAENNNLPYCFITDNDITGGNSGSPVLNAKGELVGVAFDGNWEAMSGDIIYEPDLQRTINLDIRFVVFIIDKYANAQNIMSELKIVH